MEFQPKPRVPRPEDPNEVSVEWMLYDYRQARKGKLLNTDEKDVQTVLGPGGDIDPNIVIKEDESVDSATALPQLSADTTPIPRR